MNNVRGVDRESSLSQSAYFQDSYFSMRQLCSFAHQLNEIYKLKPKTILEIGIGNGFVSSYLKRAGFDVFTVDINPDLKPDLVSTIDELPSKLGDVKFDLVVCCEVLEHMPFENFDNSLSIFKMYSDNLFLTLPNNNRWFGISGFLRLPKIERLVSLGFEINRRKLDDNHYHFWEINSSKNCTRAIINRLIGKKYKKINNGRFKLNSYHDFFVCSV